MIHIENDQHPSQLMQCHNLFFTRTLSAFFSRNDRINTHLLSIPLLGSCQENFLQKSYNLGFDFVLQYMKKSNPRTSTPHLLFFSSPFFLFFHSIFPYFFLNFFSKFFLSYHTLRSLISYQNPTIIP